MIRSSMFIVAMMCLAVVSCLPSLVIENDGEDTLTSTWDENLPPSPFTKEQIEKWIEEIKVMDIDLVTKDGAIDGISRMKRNTDQRDTSHWCCNREDAGQTGPMIEVIKAKVVQKAVPAGETIKCGFLGLSRCSSPRTTVMTVTEYYIDYEYPTIPAPEWTNGCPKDNVVCCNGYVFYELLGNCLTFMQFENILTVMRENQEALAILSSFLGGML